MKASSNKIPLYNYKSNTGKDKEAFIEIANEDKSGETSWEDGSSIRKTVYDSDSGKFDSLSSKELPTWDLSRMVEEGGHDDVFTTDERNRMIDSLTASLRRKP